MLETERLILRPFTVEDFDAVHAYASNPANILYMGWGPNERQDTKDFLAECIEKAQSDPRLEYDFAITLKNAAEQGKLIGGCGLYLNQEKHTAMLGWILHLDYWNKGYMTETCRELLRFGFTGLGLHRIYATCNRSNHGSYRVMEKCGMRREAHFLQNRHGRVGDRQTWFDEFHYGILSKEWERQGS